MSKFDPCLLGGNGFDGSQGLLQSFMISTGQMRNADVKYTEKNPINIILDKT